MRCGGMSMNDTFVMDEEIAGHGLLQGTIQVILYAVMKSHGESKSGQLPIADLSPPAT